MQSSFRHIGSTACRCTVLSFPPKQKNANTQNTTASYACTIVGCSPSNHSSPLPSKLLIPQLWRWQTQWYHILGFPRRFIKHQNRNIIIKSDPAELRMGNNIRNFKSYRSGRFVASLQVNISQSNSKLTWWKPTTITYRQQFSRVLEVETLTASVVSP